MKAIWNGNVVADAPREDIIYIEGNWYFPPESVNQDYLRKSPTPYTCPWKGVCQYFDVGKDDKWGKDNAFCYPDPLKSSFDIVKKDYSGYVAFWQDVTVSDK
jgi:uncharacterized protein (DUF427 family)